MLSLEKENLVTFGLFRADLETGELWKGGRKIRLQSQPFKVLRIMLEHPGEVVSHEDLKIKVWDPGTNVDFDRARAGAINKIREALGDSAETPQYVETLPKIGYRFIAPIQITGKTTSLTGARGSAPLELRGTPTPPQFLPEPIGASNSQAPAEIVIARSRYGVGRRLVVITGLAVGLAVLIASVCLSVAFRFWRSSVQEAPARIDQLTYDGSISSGPPNAENLPALLALDNRLITSVLVDGKPQIANILAPSGELQQMKLPQELASTAPLNLSRDGAKLLVLSRLSSSSEQPLWIVPSEGGSALRVGNILAHDATWMPDGRGIMYASGNNLMVVSSEGGSVARFAALPGRAFWLRWSPDGKVLRFTLIDPLRHSTALWEMSAGSRSPHAMQALGDDHPYSCCGTWTSNGSAYVFEEARPGTTDVWELREGVFGSRLRQLTNGPLRFFSPVVARSGRQVYLLGADRPLGIQRFDPVHNEFIPGPAFLKNATRVSFSRDANWVAWTDGDGLLWRARASDGTERLKLTPSDLEVFSAAWSPDDRKLALMARMPGQFWQIYLISAAGGELKHVAETLHNAADPTWSADGKLLAFGGEPDLMGKENEAHIIDLLNIESGKVTAVAGSDGLFSPRWSPDGEWIAALSLDQKLVRIFNVRSKLWRDLIATSAADPAWSTDSKTLIVHAFLAAQQPLLRIDVQTGAFERVADLSELRSKAPVNYFFSGLMPTNEPLILPRVGTSNLYTLTLRP